MVIILNVEVIFFAFRGQEVLNGVEKLLFFRKTVSTIVLVILRAVNLV